MERRDYSRIKVSAEGAFFVQENGKNIYDFSGIIDNVCEGGICIKLEKTDYKQIRDYLEIGKHISFQALDEKGYGVNHETGVFKGKVTVVRVDEDDDLVLVGCKIAGDCQEFQDYVKGKKIYMYMQAINRS